MEYTRRHEHIMLKMSEKEQEEDILEEDILEYLWDKDSFMDFGEGLKRTVRKKMPAGYPKEEAFYLKARGAKQNISFNRNTLKSWFEGTAPKKGDKDRQRMFWICFALELNIEETTEFFQKVYGDQAFNLRNYKEFVYFCCINNGWGYAHAVRMIEQIEFDSEASDHTMYTRVLHDKAKELAEEQDIVQYIMDNRHNFDIRNRTAKKLVEELIGEIKGRKEEIDLLQKGKIDENCSYIAQECRYNPLIWKELKYTDHEADGEEKSTKKSFFSIHTMVDIIYGFNLIQARIQTEQSLLKNSSFPQAVKGRFPDQQTFNKLKKKEVTSEELRKMLILLYSYKFWIVKDYEKADIGFTEYRDGLNDLLYEAYLQKLYIGNPFDWLFLYCTCSRDSLGLFRALIGEGLLS